MRDPNRPVTADELHAFADGQLEGEDLAHLEDWLKDHPEDAEAVRAWQAQNQQIRATFSPYEQSMPGDGRLVQDRPAKPVANRGFGRTGLAAAAICLFVAGAVTGHMLPFATNTDPADMQLHEQASSAFLIYTSEVRHPVEVRAEEKDHLATWLGKRLGHKFSTPDLSATGFSLVGGRLVPVSGEAGALLMYENKEGKRLTVLVGKSEQNAVTSFRFASNGPVETFYWIDDRLSYAVSGEIPRDALRKVADDCYRQFQS